MAGSFCTELSNAESSSSTNSPPCAGSALPRAQPPIPKPKPPERPSTGPWRPAAPSLATLNRRWRPRQRGKNMNHQKIEALGRPRTPDLLATRLLTLSQPHHFPTCSGMTESLFAYRDRLAELRHSYVDGWVSSVRAPHANPSRPPSPPHTGYR